tara:strand:+ start:401 stop:1402 length:1002 start_codon:yes stop_codon:yes gene_type:complete
MTKADPKPKRPPKKTDMLEVRVSPEEKAAFLDACRELGRSASSVIRDAMRAYASFGPMARLPGSPIMIISAFAGAALGAFALIQITNTADAADDGRLYGMEKFELRDSDNDRILRRAEFITSGSTIQSVLSGSGWTMRSRASLYSDLVGGVLLPWGLEPSRFTDHPEAIPAACWLEIQHIHQRQETALFEGLDANADGQVSAREFSDFTLAQYLAGYRRADHNGDGQLDLTDLDPQPASTAAAPPLGPPHSFPTYFDEGFSEVCDAARIPLGGDSFDGADAGPLVTYYSDSRESWMSISISVALSPENAAIARFDIDGDGATSFEEYVTGMGG